jgi:hypothetical protein
MTREPPRSEHPRPLGAAIVPVQRALIARAKVLEDKAAVAKADGYYDDRVEYAHGYEDGLLEAKAIMAAEFRALAEELGHW